MITAITILSIICILLIFAKYAWGIELYLLLFFLVPSQYLYLGDLVIGDNMLSLILLLVYFAWSMRGGGVNRTSISLVTPFLLLYLMQLFIIPFHFSGMPIIEQLNYFRIDIMRVILPFVILSIVIYDKRNASILTGIMYIVIAISSLYCLFLVTMPGYNPYIDAIYPILGQEVIDQDKVLLEGIRLFGYISSVYPHVTEFGCFLIFASVFLLYQFKRDRSIIPKILFGLVLASVIVCGSRSVLLGEGLVIMVYLLYHNQFKVLIVASILISVVVLLIYLYLPDYWQYVNSIGDDSVNGSSIDLRLQQYRGCFEAIEHSFTCGLGYNWTGWYLKMYGGHPTMIAFESCLMQILCNNGIVGLVIWGIIILFVFKTISKYFKGNIEIKRTVSLLMVGYFGYTFFTGDYGAFRVMIVFYALIVANELSCQKI